MAAVPTLRLATRGSPLARVQAGRVADLLAASGVATSVVVVETEGDRRTDVPLGELAGRGVFATEVQRAVATGAADAAVHSAKDLPAAAALQTGGLVLAAYPERGDPRDVLVGATLATLARGATVATGSARRRVQLAAVRPDLVFTDLRGNMATRLAVAGTGGVAAVVAARAALDRLGWAAPPGVVAADLPAAVVVPQVGQGALAVECRADDGETLAALRALDDPAVRTAVECERAFLAGLGGGCTVPVGAHAVADRAAGLRLTAVLARPDGVLLRHEAVGSDGVALGRAAAAALVAAAGGAGALDWSVPVEPPA